jgi:hypothetical protein
MLLVVIIISSALAGGLVDKNEFGSGYIAHPSSTLDGIEPEANWIWDGGAENPQNYYLSIRKVFTLDNPVSQASAFISAHSFAQLYINGKFVERVPVKSDPEYQVYEHFDLGSYFVQGENTIAVLVYNYGVGMHHHINARGGFFFQGRINDTEGHSIHINSDKSWKVCTADAWDSNTHQRHVNHLVGFREKYDAARALAGWQTASFDDSKWEDATEIGVPPVAPWNSIVVVKRPFLARVVIEPVASWESKGYRVYDFGKVFSACPEFTINAAADGMQFDIGTAERLDSDKLPTMTLELDYTDTYITTKGRQTWKPITWRGFRYFAIQQNPQVNIERASAEFRSYPVQNKGSFLCSDSELNRYWEIGRWTLQLCSQDTLMDTPWREQTQYIAGDSRYDMRYANYAFGPEAQFLFKYNILSGAFSQRWKKDGSIRSRYPTDWLLGPTTSTYIPDYQLEWIMMIHEYYLYYADETLVKQVYPNMTKLMDYFETYINREHDLLGSVPGWVVLDHPDSFPMDVHGENTAMNCLYYGALNSASWLARNVMKDNSQADAWAQTGVSVKNAVNKRLFSENDGVYKDGFESSRLTQQTQVYALKYGLVPDDKKANVVHFVTGKGRSCEESFSYWLLSSMFSEGQGQWALDYIRTYWGHEANAKEFNGAWHEGWDSQWGSSSHAWCGGPTALLPEKVLGVEPILPGWKKFSIKPCLYDLEWAAGVIPTAAGDIIVKLQEKNNGKANQGMQINAVIPADTVSEIYVPVNQTENVTIYADEKIIWKNGAFFDRSNRISYLSKTSDFVVFEFQQGSYVIYSVEEG